MSTYDFFKDQSSSEKIVIATVDAGKRLVGWKDYVGDVYQLVNFDFNVLKEVRDSATPLISVSDLASVVAGSFFHDRHNKIIYLQTSDSQNPNSKFMTMVFTNYYSNVPVHIPYDLSTGYDVECLPLIKSSSAFGVELDNQEQLGLAIEGSGSVSLHNDSDYWDARYERWVWDNQTVCIYSYNRDIPITEAKLIFEGVVNDKSHSSTNVTFKLKDSLAALREDFPLVDLAEATDTIIPSDLGDAKQRRIYGRIQGYRPTNIDQLVDGYLLDGTIQTTGGTDIVTGTGTTFLNDISPEDEVFFNDDSDDLLFTVKSVDSDTQITLTEEIGSDLDPGSTIRILPSIPKNYINRKWFIAGHECRQLETTVVEADSVSRFRLAETTDLEPGDSIFVGPSGSGELAKIERVFSDGFVKIDRNLLFPITFGTEVIRPAVQNVRINKRTLVFDRDYTIQISGDTRITLDAEAEKNIESIKVLFGALTFTSGSRNVTGSGTSFESQLKPGYWIRAEGQVEFFEISSIQSNTALELKTVSSYTDTDNAFYKKVDNFNPENDILSVDSMGTTSDDTKAGELLKTASKIVEDILKKVNITNISATAFSKADNMAPYILGFKIPEARNGTTSPKIRKVINEVNVSVFGSLVQNEDFVLEYNVLQPKRPPSTTLSLREADILSLSIDSTSDNIVKDVIVSYNAKDYNYLTEDESTSTHTRTSQIGQYLVKRNSSRTIISVLTEDDDSVILANRWSYLLETSNNVLKIKTKLQATRLQVNDVILVEHEKLYDRIGGGKRKFAAIQSIKKNGSDVIIEADDLGNSFNRVCTITETGEPTYNGSDDRQKAANGFITDEYGMQKNDEETFGLNVIW